MIRKVFLLLVFSLSLLLSTCTSAMHCDLRFCRFTIKEVEDDNKNKFITLWYTPVETIYNPKGHTFSASVLDMVYREHPEEEVEYYIEGKGQYWTRVNDYYYVIPQVILNENQTKEKLEKLLCGDSYWDEYKYSYEDFLSLTFDERVEGLTDFDTVYYCVFSFHRARN